MRFTTAPRRERSFTSGNDPNRGGHEVGVENEGRFDGFARHQLETYLFHEGRARWEGTAVSSQGSDVDRGLDGEDVDRRKQVIDERDRPFDPEPSSSHRE